MEKKVTIEKLLKKINHENAIYLIDLVFDNLKEENEYGENLLHILVNEMHNEEKCIIAIEALLKLGVNVNHLDNCKCNFIQTALNTGYSEEFVCACTKLAIKYGLDVNNQDEDGDTIIHEALLSYDYSDGIFELLNLLVSNSYNPTLKNNDKKCIYDLVFETKKYNNIQKRKLIAKIDNYMSSYCKPQSNKNKIKR